MKQLLLISSILTLLLFNFSSSVSAQSNCCFICGTDGLCATQDPNPGCIPDCNSCQYVGQRCNVYEDPTGASPAQLSDLEQVFTNVLSFALAFALLAVFIMFIMGGFKYITSAGDPKKAESASKTLTFAVLGLVLVAISYLILVFISTYTGIDLTYFQIRQ